MYVKPGPELISRELETLTKSLPAREKPEIERIINTARSAAGKCDIRDTFFAANSIINLSDRKKISRQLQDTVLRLIESILDRSCGCRVK